MHHPPPAPRLQVILFVDEVHLVLGAGKAEGAMDAANLLKPMLARGELRLIGATTLDEYREHVEKDAAFERRFQQVRARVLSAPAQPASQPACCAAWRGNQTLGGQAAGGHANGSSRRVLFPPSPPHSPPCRCWWASPRWPTQYRSCGA